MSNYVNVLVHGLFFLRKSETGENLELVAPVLDALPHKFLGGVRGHLQDLNGNVDWTKIGLIGKDQANLGDVKTSILQFSRKDNDLGQWKPTDSSGNSNFTGVISLPWPLEFNSVRCDYFDRVFLYQTSSLGDKIKGACRGNDTNAKIGIITCLTYEYDDAVAIPFWRPDTNLHCYYEPCKKHSIDEVNADLYAARKCFEQPQNFNLQMMQAAGLVFTARGELCPARPIGLDVDDDYSLPEDPLAKEQGKCPRSVAVNINPANCPSFFVNP